MTPMEEALELLVAGMGGVFLFLIILVILMGCTANFFKKYAHLFPEKEEPVAKAPQKADSNVDIAIAVAAVKAYIK